MCRWRAVWSGAAARPGRPSACRWPGHDPAAGSLSRPHECRRPCRARRPGRGPGTDPPGCGAAACPHRRKPRDPLPAGRPRRSPPARPPGTAPAGCGRPASPGACRRAGRPPAAPWRPLPDRHRWGSPPAPRTECGTRCRHPASTRPWSRAGRPSAPWRPSWRTWRGRRHTCRPHEWSARCSSRRSRARAAGWNRRSRRNGRSPWSPGSRIDGRWHKPPWGWQWRPAGPRPSCRWWCWRYRARWPDPLPGLPPPACRDRNYPWNRRWRWCRTLPWYRRSLLRSSWSGYGPGWCRRSSWRAPPSCCDPAPSPAHASWWEPEYRSARRRAPGESGWSARSRRSPALPCAGRGSCGCRCRLRRRASWPPACPGWWRRCRCQSADR